MDGVFSGSISQDDVILKSYSLGSNDDVQKQYPTYVTAEGDITDGKEWKRSLNGNGGKTTIVDASVMKKKSRMFQDKLRKGDESLILPIIAYYGTGRLWDNHRARRVTSKDQFNACIFLDSGTTIICFPHNSQNMHPIEVN